jgi:hypothetical protein
MSSVFRWMEGDDMFFCMLYPSRSLVIAFGGVVSFVVSPSILVNSFYLPRLSSCPHITLFASNDWVTEDMINFVWIRPDYRLT